MPPASYRLDVVCAKLIERLEGARPTFQGDDARAEDRFRAIAEEQIEGVIVEHDEILGTPGWGALLRREVMETFLPRYTRLALDHNQIEAAGYHSWRRGDPVARVVMTFVALGGASMAYQLTHHPLSLALFVLALAVPFLPEIRRGWYRKRYTDLLQEVIDDMGRIQDSLDGAPPRMVQERIQQAREQGFTEEVSDEARERARQGAAAREPQG
ncbi:MAG: hypothetical protein H6742_03930 [Alphaproteobacteria bacterium]|nr:hypothetical protein [Alphaproteobacteria bacterium]